MTDMIEKMARAIHAASYHPDDLNNSIVEEHWEVEKGKAFKRAKAALSALEEPSPQMTKAAAMLMNTAGYNACSRNGRAGAVWDAMIKAAKGEE